MISLLGIILIKDFMHNKIKEEKLEKLACFCKKRGQRLTKQRELILEALMGTTSHPSAEMVLELVKNKIPNISLDTIYRTLAFLEKSELIFRIDHQLPKARFDADKREHHHFICQNCNEVYDVFVDKNDTIKLPSNAKNFGIVKNVNLQITGICNNCKNRKDL